jgi:hypothetical protein
VGAVAAAAAVAAGASIFGNDDDLTASSSLFPDGAALHNTRAVAVAVAVGSTAAVWENISMHGKPQMERGLTAVRRVLRTDFGASEPLTKMATRSYTHTHT